MILVTWQPAESIATLWRVIYRLWAHCLEALPLPFDERSFIPAVVVCVTTTPSWSKRRSQEAMRRICG